MNIPRLIIFVLFTAVSSFAGLRLSFTLGGTSSYLGYEFNDSSRININEEGMRSFLLSGTAIEVLVKETFGMSVGMNLEDKGGTLRGNWVNWLNGDFEFKYRYLQIPIHGLVIIPLLIPGSVYLSVGPEIGITLDHSWIIRLEQSLVYVDIEDFTTSYDFGVSGALGYEYPIGRYFGIRIWGNYYYGLVDQYENHETSTSDFDLYHRAIKYGASFIANLIEF